MSDAQPLQPSAAPPDFDEAFFEHRPAAPGFDDLHDDAHDHAHDDAHDDRERAPGADEAVEAGAADEQSEQLAAVTATAEGNGTPVVARDAQPPAEIKPVSPTPIGIERPMDLPERDIDPEVLAAAIAELDAELRLGRERKPQTSD